MSKKIGIVLLIMAVVAGIAFYFLKSATKDKTADVNLLYNFDTVQRVDLSERVDATGNVVVSNNTDIYPAYSATVQKITVKVGDHVRKGQILMVLDSPSLALEWAQDESAIRQAESALSLARNELNRIKTLFAAEGATRADLDSAQNKYDVALDQLNLARFKLVQLQNNPDHANFIAANHRSLNICAPFDGQVAWLNVRPGDPAATQSSLITIIGSDSLMAEAQVDESEIKAVKPGQPVEITLNDAEQTQIKGTVYAVGNVGTDNSGVIEYPVRIKVNPGNQMIKPQMSVDATIITREYPNALAVPSAAVVERRNRTMVAVREGNQVSYNRVTTGVNNGTYTEILSGLKEGDTIATKKAVSTPTRNNNNNNNGARNYNRMMRF
jgi:HlyD family secretion protein